MSLQPEAGPSRNRRAAGFAAVMAAVAIVAALAVPMVAGATQPDPGHKVTLCHATDSYSNPYVQVTVDVAAVLNGGHGDHVGPVFDPSLPKHTKWGDIIPAFDFGPGEQYAGMNVPDGQAFLDAGCGATTTTTGGGA